jgi:hypothetical protein
MGGRAIAQAVSHPPRLPGFDPRSGHVGFVVDEVALGQVFSKYFCFPGQFSFHRLLHTSCIIRADVPSGLSLTPPPRNLKNYRMRCQLIVVW